MYCELCAKLGLEADAVSVLELVVLFIVWAPLVVRLLADAEPATGLLRGWPMLLGAARGELRCSF